ncbi:MAG: AlpA family phage regulatory protein [Nitrosospira sp.]|nr:AlpA family phage regulatory protein [Nitrosospira sp.]
MKVPERRFIKIRRVLDKVGISKSHLYALVAKKQFPAPIKLGRRSSVWMEPEVDEWMDAAESQREEC